jgi:hypothetical protein
LSRNKLIYCIFFSIDGVEEENIKELVYDMKNINKHLRCFGIFKNNLKKSWKFTEERFLFIQKFDPIIIEEGKF